VESEVQEPGEGNEVWLSKTSSHDHFWVISRIAVVHANNNGYSYSIIMMILLKA
jgi:hypothetical protein